MSELPLEQELREALHNDLWLLRREMEQGPEVEETPPAIDYQPPARFFLPLLHAALEKWDEGRGQAQTEVPKSLHWKLKLSAMRDPNWLDNVAKDEPEVRRYWLVDRLSFLMQQAIEILENEGRPQARIVLPNLTKMRSR